jgi:hypothetical protein
MRHIAVALAGVLVLNACASLMTPSGSAAARWARLDKARAEKASGADAGKICKNMTVMGSNFPERVCSTEAEWDQFDKANRQSAEDFDAQRRSGNTQVESEGAGQR